MAGNRMYSNWMVAVAEAAEVAGTADLDAATGAQLEKAWELVTSAAEITREELATNIAQQSGLPVADFSKTDAHAALLVPAELARRRHVMPIRCTERELAVATANPLSQDAKRELAGIASRTIRFEIAAPRRLAEAIREAYGEPSEDEGAAASPPERVRPGGPHVLVVDDEAGARALSRSVLEESGFRVTLAKDGAEAIDLLTGPESFDLMTLDYFMDRMNGLRVLQNVRANPRHRGMPVIMVTGADDRRIEMSLFEAGADDFVVKPIDAPLFILRIQAVLRRRQLR
jgi:CheY-like chemotaxis protein